MAASLGMSKTRGTPTLHGTNLEGAGKEAAGSYFSGGIAPALGDANGSKTSKNIAGLDAMARAKLEGRNAPAEIQKVQAPKFDESQFKKADDPRAAMINMAPQDQFRQQQSALASQLAQQASGQGPSIANAQMQQGQEAAAAQQFAQMASARGGANPALARQAMNNNAQQQSQLAQQAGINRMQEQQGAQGLLANVAGGARGQDINLATTQAGMEQQTNLAKYTGDQASAQQFNDLKMKYAQQGLSAEQSNQMAAMEMEKQRLNQQNLDVADANAATNKRNENARSVVSGAGTAIGSLFGM